MEAIEKCRREITAHLQNFLSTHLPRHQAKEIYYYSLLPPGKLLRPLLVRAVATDLKDYQCPAHSYLELFVEVHHVYTLIHDDLPCMDNDSIRRGRPTVHCKFDEGKALLTGDGLAHLSYRILSLIESPRLPSLLRYSTWALGPKGLIQGQYQDLSQEMNQNFSKLVDTHRLKTSRLIQTSIVGAGILSERASLKALKDLHRLGEHLGIAFQLLDDLEELAAEVLSNHESKINPFLTYPSPCAHELQYRLEKMEGLLRCYQLFHTQKVLGDYFKKTNRMLSQKRDNIKDYIGTELLRPIQEILHGLSFNNDTL